MRHRRRRFGFAISVGAGIVLAGCAPMGSGDGYTTLRLSLNQAENHPSFIALDNWATYMEEHSDQVRIEVFPNETLGAQAESLQLVSTGIADMAIASGTQLENLHEDFLVFNMPRVFDDVDHQIQVIRDPAITGDLFTSLEESNNITLLGGFIQGTRSVYSTTGPGEVGPKTETGYPKRGMTGYGEAMSRTIKLAVIAGDGIGQDVTAEARKVLDAALHGSDVTIEATELDLGAGRYHRTGETLTDEDLDTIKAHDAILLGAVGDPSVPSGVLERGLLLRLRFELDHFVNLRPAKIYPGIPSPRSEEHTSELQSRGHLVCRLL